MVSYTRETHGKVEEPPAAATLWDARLDDDGDDNENDSNIAARLRFEKLHDVLQFAAEKHATKTAYARSHVTTAGGETLEQEEQKVTYAEMYARVRNIAEALKHEFGLHQRDRVGIMLLNSPEYLETYYAVSQADCISVHLNPRLASSELRPVIEDCQCKLIIAHATNADIVKTLMGASLADSSCHTVVWVGGTTLSSSTSLHASADHASTYNGLGIAERDYEDVIARCAAHGNSTAIDIDSSTKRIESHGTNDTANADIEAEVATLFYTSGTTGKAKGVMQKHQNLLRHALRTREALQWRLVDAPKTTELQCSEDALTWGHFGAMFHIGDSWSDFAVTEVGGRHAFCPQFDLTTIVDIIRREKVTHTKLVPTMIQLLLDSSHVSPSQIHNISSLRLIMVSGSPLGEDVVRKAVKRLPGGCSLGHAYGMTETCGHTGFVNPLVVNSLPEKVRAQKLTTCGQGIAGTRMVIVDPNYEWDKTATKGDDDDGPRLMETNEVGELLVAVTDRFDGYWRNHEESQACVYRGWLRTGDIGRIDEDGFMSIIDRKKDMIISGGENVFSAEVEQVLRAHNAVVAAAVYGVKNALLGELVEAAVVLRDDVRERGNDVINLVIGDLKRHCQEHLAPFKVPRNFETLDALPQSANGKIQKRILRDRAAARLAPAADTGDSGVASDWRLQKSSEATLREAEDQEREVLKKSLWHMLQTTGTHRNRNTALQASQTAEVACFMRHLAHLKSDPKIQGGDNLARNFIFNEHALLATSSTSSDLLTEIYDDKFPGMFGHLAARTNVFDSIVRDEAPRVTQIVILGAGYDTRAYRMDCLRGKKVFEVDAPGTQSMKLLKLEQAGIIHGDKNASAAVYVSVDFETQKFEDRLAESGFDASQKTLWVWEFVSPYLSPHAVAETCAAVRRASAPGSMLAFDYLYRDMASQYGGKAFHRGVLQSGESIRWTVKEGGIDAYLNRRGFVKESEWKPEDLERDFLTDVEGTRRHRSFGFYCIVLSRSVNAREHEALISSLDDEEDDTEEVEVVGAGGISEHSSSLVHGHDGIVGSDGTVLAAVRTSLAKQIGGEAHTLKGSDALLSAGLDSLMAIAFAEDLRKELNIDIADTIAFEYPTIDALVSHLAPHVVVSTSISSSSVHSGNGLDVLQGAVRRSLAKELGDDAALGLSGTEQLLSAGLDSLMAISLAEGIRKELNIDVADTIAFEYPTIDALVSHLAPRVGSIDSVVSKSARSSLDGENVVQGAIRRSLANELGEDVASGLSGKDQLLSAGLDSLMAISFAEGIRKELNIDIADTVVFEYPTIDALVSHLSPAAKTVMAPAAAATVPHVHTAETYVNGGVSHRRPKKLAMKHLFDERDTDAVLAKQPYLPFWWRMLGTFSYIYACLVWFFRPFTMRFSSTIQLRPLTPLPYVKRIPLAPDDVFLSKLDLSRTLFFKSKVDVDRLEAALRYVLDSFPSLSGCMTQRNGHLFVSYGGSYFAPLRVRSALYEREHWIVSNRGGKVVVPPAEFRVYVFLRTFGKALGAYGAIFWPKPVLEVELLHACGSEASANGDYLTVSMNHGAGDGQVFDRFLKSLALAYDGKPVVSTASVTPDSIENRTRVKDAYARLPPVLIDYQKREFLNLGYFQYQFRLSQSTMAMLRECYARDSSAHFSDSDVILTAIWDMKRRQLIKDGQDASTDVCVAFHKNIRNYVPGLSDVQGNLFMSTQAMCPAPSSVSDADLERGAVIEQIVHMKRKLTHSVDDVVNGLSGAGTRRASLDQASLVPITQIPDLLDNGRTSVIRSAVMDTATSTNAGSSSSSPAASESRSRVIVHMNDLSHQTSRFVLAEETANSPALVGTESAHPDKLEDFTHNGGSCATSWSNFEEQLSAIHPLPIWFCRVMPDAKIGAESASSGTRDLILMVCAGNLLINP